MSTAVEIGEVEPQARPLGRGKGQFSTAENDEQEGYGDSSTKIWKFYGTESKKYDRALVDSWKGNTDSMLIFTGLFSSIVASFLIETYKTLTPGPGPSGAGDQTVTHSAVRVNILMFLSLFFSVTSALVSTLIQQWAREYLQYSQPSATPHKRGRMRAYLFGGLSRFKMRRLTHGVPVLLHVAVFLFFYALSEWLHSINTSVGNTARYCLVALLAVYMALSVLPLIVRDAPYRTALTTPLQACVSIIQFLKSRLRRLVRRTSRGYEDQNRSGLFKSVRANRARALMKEIKRRASDLDRSAMQWLLQELDEDDMDTFLSGLPGYIHSRLIDKKVVVEGLMEDGVPGRIRDHITTCLRSVELTPDESMSRASACINSLRLISETAANTAARRPDLESDDILAIMEYLERHCYDPSTALRAFCIRGLVIREYLILLAGLGPEESQTASLPFPDYLLPLYRVIRMWKTTQMSQWPSLAGILTDTRYPLPNNQEMWADVLYDGPLINLVVLANAVLSHEGDVDLDMTWTTFEILLKSLGLAQVRATRFTLNRFDEVLVKARGRVTPLLKTLDIVISGLHLARAFANTPRPLPPRQVEAIFGPEQLRDSELLEAFALHLPGLVGANTGNPEVSKSFMERLILEDKLWEQLHVSLVKCVDPQTPFPNKLRIVNAFFDILDVAFEVLNDSSNIDWQSPDLSRLLLYISDFGMTEAPGGPYRRIVNSRSVIFYAQFCHALLVQFSKQRERREPLVYRLLPSLSALVGLLGVGTQEDIKNLTLGIPESTRTGFDMMIKADATLTVALNDGPLIIFFILGTTIFEAIVSEASDATSDDVSKLWEVLERILDPQHLPLANASGEKWATFDHFRATVRGAAMGGNSQNADNFQRLLDKLEDVEGMRPPSDRPAERTGDEDNGSRAGGTVPVVQDAQQPSEEVPIPGSSREVETSLLLVGGAPRDQRGLHLGSNTVPTTGTAQFTPHGSTPLDLSNPDQVVVNEPPIPSISTTQLIPRAETPYTHRPHILPVHPLRFAVPLIPGSSGPRRASSLDPAILQAQAYIHSVLTDIPEQPRLEPRRMFTYPSSSPSPSSGPLGVSLTGHANRDSPVRTSGYFTPGANRGDNPGGE